MRVLAAIALLAIARTAAAAQADGVIAGQVVDGGSGRPVSGAIVSLTGAGTTVNPLPNRPPQILTAGDGRFVFGNLGAGAYAIRATKGGYAEGASGRRRPGGPTQSVEFSAAARSADIVVRVWKYGAITGAVTDDAGEPMVGVQVRALIRTRQDPGSESFVGPMGFQRMLGRPFTTTATAYTDDRGIYRFGDLVGGDYMIVASVPPSSARRSIVDDMARNGSGSSAQELMSLFPRISATPLLVGEAFYTTARGAPLPSSTAAAHVRIYPPTFYPTSAGPAQASLVSLAIGEERSGVDIQLAPVRTARVSGTVVSTAGPVGLATLRLVPADGETVPSDVIAPTSISDGAGAFIFAAVVPGRYALRGSISGGALGIGFVDVPITVAGDDLDDIVVMANPSPKITAHLQFDGNAPRPALSSDGRPYAILAFVLDSADAAGNPDRLAISTNSVENGIVMTGYPPGRYRVRVQNSPTGWMFKAAMLNGVDVSDTPFDLKADVTDLTLVFTDRWSGVSGTVQGAGRENAGVLVFPTDAQRWSGPATNPRRFRLARADPNGQFGLSSLPPGDYFVVAIPDEQAGDWRDPAMLDSLARVATQLTVFEGEHKTIDLQLRQVRQ